MKAKLIVAVMLSWAQFAPVLGQTNPAPAARSGYSMAYDDSRGVVVLFGGQDTASARLGDTWEWHDGVWQQINITGPGARFNAAMAYDADKHKVVLFGGRAETGSQNDLWEYDGKAWVMVKTSAAPPARQLGTMVYDKSQSQFVLFGGMDVNRKTLDDTWILKNASWTKLKSNGPSARASQCMAYNDDMGAVFVYSGYVNDTGSRELWKFKDGKWNTYKDENGPPRIHASIVFDTDNKRFLLFAGFGDEGRTNELWEFKDSHWTRRMPGNNPVPETRAEHRAVYIPGKGMLVFGGVIGADPNTRVRANDTWIYYEDKWTKIN